VRLLGCVDGGRHLVGAGLVVGGQDVLVVVRLDHDAGVAGAHLLAADDQRDLDLGRIQLLQPGFQAGSFGGARRVVADRLVVRIG
jgi:hypothetical protein